METKRIFKVKVGIKNIISELEFNDSFMQCVTGEVIHFKIFYKNIRAYEFQKPNKIALNFYVDSKLTFFRITSKFAIEITETIKKLTT